MQCRKVAQPRRHAINDRFKQNLDHTTAALSRRGSQWKTSQRRTLIVEHADCDASTLILELGATDRANRLRRRDNHLRADFAWRGAADTGNCNEHCRLTSRSEIR